MKTCSTCKLGKDKKEFNKDRSKKDGLCMVCRECNRKRSESYRNNPMNKESLKAGFKKYAKTDKGYASRRRVRNKLRKKQTPQQRLIHNMRVRIANGLKTITKSAKTIELIDCSWNELRTHLESFWLPGMSWQNYGKGEGKWSVDHIKPLTQFDLTDSEQQKICFHYTNLQPLWYIDNSKKGGRYDD